MDTASFLSDRITHNCVSADIAQIANTFDIPTTGEVIEALTTAVLKTLAIGGDSQVFRELAVDALDGIENLRGWYNGRYIDCIYELRELVGEAVDNRHGPMEPNPEGDFFDLLDEEDEEDSE